MEKEMHIVMAVDISEGSEYGPFVVTIEDNYNIALSKAMSFMKDKAAEWNIDPEKACDFDNLRVADEMGTKGLQCRIQNAAVSVSVKYSV